MFGWREWIGGDVGCECDCIGAGEGVVGAGDVVNCPGSNGGGMLVVVEVVLLVFVLLVDTS